MLLKPEGIFGGAFDPIHCGHLAVAAYLSTHCPLTKIQFIPCLLPPHRSPLQASPQHRLAMIRLAIEGHSNWIANDIDFQRPGPSYMVDTLVLLKQRQPQTPWCLILGMDAFLHFNEWREWQKILTLAHLIVVNRPGFELPHENPLQALLAHQQIYSSQDLTQSMCGHILLQNIPPSPIAATHIRQRLVSNHPQNDLPPAVLAYIQHHGLYAKS